MSAQLLLDAQAVLWWLADDQRLSDAARELIEDPANRLLVSAASVWEMAIKRALGKLDVPDELLRIIEEQGFELLDVKPEHAWAVQELPRPAGHKDPFDRLLVCQAAAERLEILSPDGQLDQYAVRRRW